MNHAVANSTLLRNARIVLPERTLEAAGLLIENGRISRVFDSSTDASSTADSQLDLTGLTLFPGFIDVHLHGAVGVDTMAASTDDLRRVSEFLARRGVTAWMPTLVPAPAEQYERATRAIEDAMKQISIGAAEQCSEYRLQSGPADSEKPQTEPGSLNTCRARVLGVHYEGPFVSSQQCGALHSKHFRAYHGPADLDSLPTVKDEKAVHLMTLAPEIDGGIALIKELTKRGWITSIGHTRANPGMLDEASRAGARHMTHFMNAMTPLHHRVPGPVGWGLINDEVTCDIIADGVHLDPAVLTLILRAKKAERISLISDAIAAAGLDDGEYQVWGEKISVKDGRTQNLRGSIAGSVITVLDAVRMMLTLGASEPEVARMASLNPARLLRIDHDCGTLEEGKRADFVALDKALNARLTSIGGEIIRNS